MLKKLTYLGRCLKSQFQRDRYWCPNCGSTQDRVIDRKYLVTQLRRCEACKLLFRTPTDDPSANESYYENEYTKGFAAIAPADSELCEMMQTNFARSGKFYSYYIGVLAQLGLRPGHSIFDYGCSWGYGSYQLAMAGFQVTSFEVAPTRRRYAREKLGVATVDDMGSATVELAGKFDCFFSSHVLEHVPRPSQSISYARKLLKLGGLFVSFTPNGNDEHRTASPFWSSLWGEVHPNFIDGIFLDNAFKNSSRSIGSSPITNACLPDQAQLKALNSLDGSELFFVARNGSVAGDAVL